ncbi:hypothetical protein SAMN05216364_100862 [Porphyromonadaceae bacterium KHP3R9]|jgi:hypothetical protein|nr:hypothetical protein SAMN05216364_100862 [Porphyromonadaceae bacterium KHP3R9]
MVPLISLKNQTPFIHVTRYKESPFSSNLFTKSVAYV